MLAAIVAVADAASAQTLEGCTVVELTDPARRAYECTGGLVLEAEAAAELGLAAPGADDATTEITLRSGAVLVDVDPGRPVQIRTPQAIAAVRGTQYVVDATTDATAVFVVRGAVSVRRAGESDGSVVLGPGDGVDVTLGGELVVRQWRPERARALLARLGR